jgi:hypothetical protein
MKRLQDLFLILLFLLFTQSGLAVHSQTTEIKLSVEGKKAFDTLLSANQFEDKANGYAGEPSKLVEAFNVLLNEPMADTAFKKVLEKATLPGQLYALCGLWFTDNAYFRSAVESYRFSDQRVMTLFGCIGGAASVSNLIEDKNPAVIDINHPKESLYSYFEMDTRAYSDWNNRKNKKKSDKAPAGHRIDIINGGYPVFFRDSKYLK